MSSVLYCVDSLQPFLDLVQTLHGNCIDHHDLLLVILEDVHHIKILQVELLGGEDDEQEEEEEEEKEEEEEIVVEVE